MRLAIVVAFGSWAFLTNAALAQTAVPGPSVPSGVLAPVDAHPEILERPTPASDGGVEGAAPEARAAVELPEEPTDPAPGDFPRLVAQDGQLCVQFLDDRECVVEKCRGPAAGQETPAVIVGAVNVDAASCRFGAPWEIGKVRLDAARLQKLEAEARANEHFRHLRLRPATPRDLLSVADADTTFGWSLGFKVTAVLGLVGGLGTVIGGAVTGNGNVAAAGFAGIGGGLVSALVSVFIDAQAAATLRSELMRNAQEQWRATPSLPSR